MTTEDKVAALKQIKRIVLLDRSWTDNSKNAIAEVFDSAIANMLAWEKVKEEIENGIHHLSPEARSSMESTQDCTNKARNRGLKDALAIIDKHLKEVENEANY